MSRWRVRFCKGLKTFTIKKVRSGHFPLQNSLLDLQLSWSRSQSPDNDLTMTCKVPSLWPTVLCILPSSFLRLACHFGLSLLHTPESRLRDFSLRSCWPEWIFNEYPHGTISSPTSNLSLKCHLNNGNFTNLSYLFVDLFPVPRIVPAVEQLVN